MPWECKGCGYKTHKNLVEPVFCRCLVKALEADATKHLPLVERQRALWAELHRAPWEHLEVGFRAWLAKLPNCNKCKKHFKELLERWPPNFSSPDAFFAWSVEIHNQVNERLGKPIITLDEARAIWPG